jgi:hypothetical protein
MGQIEVGRNWLCQFLPHANFEENHQKVQLGTSLFCPEVSVHQPNQVKPTLLSHLFWTGLSGGSCYVGDTFDPLAAVSSANYISFVCVVSEPSHPKFGWDCLPTTLVAVTTLYFS